MAAPAVAAVARAVLPSLGRAVGRAALSKAAGSMMGGDDNSEEPSENREGGSSMFKSIAMNDCFYDEMGSCRS